jgi:predicted transcriptional regulator
VLVAQTAASLAASIQVNEMLTATDEHTYFTPKNDGVQVLHTGKAEPFVHFAALTDAQATAIDLYARGFNVIPLRKPGKKPYILKPFFTSRLHHCSATCHHKGRHDIADLFSRNNIGVVLGRTSGNLIDIDCDSAESFNRVGDELTGRNLPFWAIESARGGGYLLRLIEGEAANMPKGQSPFNDVEVWGSLHFAVIPPSIHTSGIVYRWITPEPRLTMPPGATLPAVSIRQLDWLGVKLAKDARREFEQPELYGLPAWAAELSQRNRLTNAEELTEGERNNRLFSMACDMKGIGAPYHEAEEIFMAIADRAGLDRKEARATFRSAYKKDRTPARKGATLKEWQRAKTFAESFDWRGTFGRKALRRQALYLACVERAKLDGRLHWRATTRELAELANLSSKKTGEGLQDLINADLIRRVNSGRQAGLYRFVGLSQSTTVYTTGRYSVVLLDTPKTTAEQDVFKKLGLVAWHVWRYLLTHEAHNAGEIAKATGLPRSSVYKALELLTHHNVRLVFRDGAGEYYAEPKTDGSFANMAAHWYDGASPAQARKDLHRLERELRVNRLTRGAIYHSREGQP